MHTRPASADPSLIGYWDFDEGAEQMDGDSSVYGNDGTIAGAVWVEDIAPVGKY